MLCYLTGALMEASALIWALFLAPGGSSGAETGHVSFTGAELQDPWALCWLLSSCSHQSDSWSSGQWTPINEALPSCVWKPEHARLDRQVRDAGRFFFCLRVEFVAQVCLCLTDAQSWSFTAPSSEKSVCSSSGMASPEMCSSAAGWARSWWDYNSLHVFANQAFI